MRYLKNSSYLANIDRSYSFLIFKEEDKDLIGGVNVFNIRRGVSQSASIGYWIGKEYARKGYMYEAINILLPFFIASPYPSEKLKYIIPFFKCCIMLFLFL